jgi:hypothetical protein
VSPTEFEPLEVPKVRDNGTDASSSNFGARQDVRTMSGCELASLIHPATEYLQINFQTQYP